MITIEELNAVPILEVARALNIKVDKYNKSLCFKHNETKPSLCFNIRDNYFKCFGCDAGGDVISLVKENLNIDFKEAIGFIKSKFFIHENKPPDKYRTVTGCRDITIQPGKKEIHRDVLRKNTEIYEALQDHCTNLEKRSMLDDEALEYLISRQLSKEILLKFMVFSIDDYLTANNFLREHYTPEELSNAGIISEKGNLLFFKHRLIFPYYENGRIVNLRGRVIGENQDSCKYLGLKNISNKRFFNIDILDTMKAGEKLFICEGEIDCISLHMLGKKAIAIPGVTNIPEKEKWEKLLKYDLNIVFDNDPAGIKALEEIKKIADSLFKKIKIIKISTKDINQFLSEEKS